MEKKKRKSDLRDLYEAYVRPGIERWKQVYVQANDDSAFLLWATELVLDELELTDEEIISACSLDGKWDLKIDSAFSDHQGKRIYLIQAKHWESTKSVGDSPFIETWESLQLLSTPKLVEKANYHTKQFHADFCNAVRQDYEVILCVATSGRILPRQVEYVQGQPKKRTVQVGDSPYEVSVTFQWFGLPELVDIERRGGRGESIGLAKKDEPVELRLEHGWYCTPKGATGDKLYDSLYTTIPAEELIPIRTRLGPELYRLNYRGPLGDRVVVNKAILATLKTIPDTFHVLNNGLAAICDHFSVDAVSQKVSIYGLQVVNGCQTLETIWSYSPRIMGKKDAKVNLRLVKCERAQGALVAMATNNQTKLRAEDFATLDPIQDDLQRQFSKLHPQPWYYEIKRRYWSNVVSKNKAEAPKFLDQSGRPRVIRFRDAAQRSLAFLGQPIIAAQKTALIFQKQEDGGHKEHVFPDKLYSYQVLLPWMIYQRINEQIEHYLDGIHDLEEKNQAREWLEYGRLTAVALTGDGLREQYNVDSLTYFDRELSKALVETIDKWLDPVGRHALYCIWNYAKRNEKWRSEGPRTVFRRPQTYGTDLLATFMASFHTSRTALTSGLPSG